MKVLMLGWEFPPYIAGGLGTACYGLTRGMNEIGMEVLFLLPRPVPLHHSSHVTLVWPGGPAKQILSKGQLSPTELVEGFEHIKIRTIEAGMEIQAYQSPEEHIRKVIERRRSSTKKRLSGNPVFEEAEEQAPSSPPPGVDSGHYGGDMFGEIERYAQLAVLVAAQEEFDVVHAHDWMTYRAGVAVAAVSGKPLIVHVHSTEFDRSGEHVNQRIYDIERMGMHFAARCIAVSHLTRNIIVSRYGVPAEKVDVVYNAIDLNGELPDMPAITRDEKLVLFLGRITMQKGPEYFLGAAKKVLDVMDNVRFIVAGSGDMHRQTIRMAAEMGVGHKVLFTGFLRGKDVERVFRMADLYVMPSVSEPFGIAPLEALSNDVPVIISKQSGVSEILTHALKVDFWDIDEMANKIIAVLRHSPLQSTLREHGRMEVQRLSWTDAARHCVEVYQRAIG